MKGNLINDINNEIRRINEGFSFGSNTQTKMMKPNNQIPTIRNEDDNKMKPQNGDTIIGKEIEKTTTSFDKTITDMRKIALRGLLDFGDNPLSDEYVFFKKIVTDCDNLFTKKNKKTDSEIDV